MSLEVLDDYPLFFKDVKLFLLQYLRRNDGCLAGPIIDLILAEVVQN